MRPILLAFALSLSALVSAQAPLVPWPRNVEWQEGDFALKQVGVIEGEGAQGWGAQLRKELSSLGATSIAADEILRSVQLIRDSTQGEEGYTIAMEKDVVRIAAGSRIGALHATRTLEQLAAPDSIGNWHWPRVRIQDAPAFAWRGTMLDVSRHFYSVAFIKRYLDELAALKMNVFHWHLTDDQGWRVEVKKFPKLTEVGAWRTEADGARYGGFYTQEEVKDVVRYAEQRGITVVPEIEFPGHCSAALAAYPQLGCRKDTIAVPTTWGVFHDVYCVGREETWGFFQSVLDELLPLFPAPWFHIGGDEVPKDRWQHCAVCQARMKNEGLKDEHALQAWAVKRLQAYLTGKGKRLIGWDEVLEGGLGSTAVVEVWRGDEQARKARANGNAIIRTLYFDASPASLTLDKVKAFDPLVDGDAHGILGAECPLWSETADERSVGYRIFPRLHVFAERMWSGEVRGDIMERTAPHVARLEQEGWVTATTDKDLFRSAAVFDPQKRDWLITAERGRPDMDVAWSSEHGSGTFTDSLRVVAPGTVKLTPRWREKPLTDATSIRIAPHLALGARQVASPPPARQYGRDPDHGMTDGLMGTTTYHDGLWQGWWGVDPTITIDLDSARIINEVRVRCLQQVGVWIVLPRTVEFFISDDGVKWQAFSTATHTIPVEGAGPLVHDFTTHPQTAVRARYVRAVLRNSGKLTAWHLGAGGDSWVFADEVIVR